MAESSSLLTLLLIGLGVLERKAACSLISSSLSTDSSTTAGKQGAPHGNGGKERVAYQSSDVASQSGFCVLHVEEEGGRSVVKTSDGQDRDGVGGFRIGGIGGDSIGKSRCQWHGACQNDGHDSESDEGETEDAAEVGFQACIEMLASALWGSQGLQATCWRSDFSIEHCSDHSRRNQKGSSLDAQPCCSSVGVAVKDLFTSLASANWCSALGTYIHVLEMNVDGANWV